MSRKDIYNHLWNKERIEPWSTVAFGKTNTLFQECIQSANTRTPDNAGHIAVNRIQVKARILYSFGSGNKAVLCIRVYLASFFPFKVVFYLKALKLAGKTRFKL